MAVNLNRQNSILGNPFLWFTLVAGGVAGFYYHKKNHPAPAEPPPVVAQDDKKPETPKSDWVEPPPPPKDAPPPVVAPDDPNLAYKPPPPKVEKPKLPDDPDIPYVLPPGTRIVKPRTGKGPDELDKEMWALDATPDKPFKWSRDIGAKWHDRVEAYLAKDAKNTVAHPCAKAFPGAVPDDAPRIVKAVRIPLSAHRWVSTGLYAPPGEIIRVEANSELKGRASVVIGCHRDNICGAKREVTHRFPRISLSRPLDKPVIELSNPFGGLIYLDISYDAARAKSVSTCRVEISGAVEAPLFVLGQTTKEEWGRLRKSPAPWGEIGGKSHFAAARSDRFRTMNFAVAKELAEYWDKAVDLQDWVCGWAPRTAPERMVPDAEISAGSGHSGYPYMGYLDWEGWCDLDSITTNGSWGHYHELGHNHQSGAWTFAGYGEVTNNVMGLLCEEKLAGIKLGDPRSWLGDLDGALAARLGPPPIEDARGNLAMYVPVIKAFGWESLRNTWAEYARKSGRFSMKLDTDERKKETFVRIWSKHCKVNLAPYFAYFGFPYTGPMRASLGDLKKWMPPDFPPKVDPSRIPSPIEIPEHGATLGDYQSD